jgi:hypothetical protein
MTDDVELKMNKHGMAANGMVIWGQQMMAHFTSMAKFLIVRHLFSREMPTHSNVNCV